MKTTRMLAILALAIGLQASPVLGMVMYVDANATGANDGSSWRDAYIHLQDALAYARMTGAFEEIRVAEGTYKPDDANYVKISAGDRTGTFTLINNVAIYGGFPPGGGSWEKRDPNVYETILSSDLKGDDDPNIVVNNLFTDTTRAENSYHVVTGNGTDKTAVLDGFIIKGGQANESGALGYGGGIYINPGAPTVTNCTFIENAAAQGGGMYNNNNSSPIVTNCTFTKNSARYLGGGMLNNNYSKPSLTKCTFSGNSGGTNGGAMCNYYRDTPTLTNCIFSGNSAGTNGGGMYSEDYSSPTLTNCTFTKNSATNGGAMDSYNGSPTLTNCTFTKNSATNVGGGMHNLQSRPKLINCIFSGNSAGTNGGGMYNDYRDSPILTNCTFSGNSARAIGGGIYSEEYSSPTVVNCTFTGNRANNGNALACRSSSTLVLADCIVWDGWSAVYDPDNCTIAITYSDVQFGLPGEGNIRANPCFADPGYWDQNGTPQDANDDFWVEGDYHLKSEAGRWDRTAKPGSRTM